MDLSWKRAGGVMAAPDAGMTRNRTILAAEVHFSTAWNTDAAGMEKKELEALQGARRHPIGPDPFGGLVNRRQLAEYLHVTERTVAAWDLCGRIPSIRIGRTVRYDLADVRRWLQRN